MLDEWLSLSEGARTIGVHPSTLRNWANQGKIPVHRTQGGHRRFKKSEIDFWLSSKQASVPEDISFVLQDAVKQMRIQISESHLEQQVWYQKIDLDARRKYRQSGRNLVQGLINYLTSNAEEGDAEARSLGYEYATRGRRNDLDISDATQAFLFFRNSLVDALLLVYENASMSSPMVLSSMVRKINEFTDRILLTIMEIYNAFDGIKKA
jgi:excisionase family DNA binding protein